MNKLTLRTIPICCILLLTILAFPGCRSRPADPQAYDISIALDAPLAGMSLQVELLGVNTTSDLPIWESMSVNEYWQPGNSRRRDANKVSFDFGRGLPTRVVFPATDSHWEQWIKNGARRLVILADLPGVTTEQSGAADSRRLILELDEGMWDDDQPIELLIQESGIRLLSKRQK